MRNLRQLNRLYRPQKTGVKLLSIATPVVKDETIIRQVVADNMKIRWWGLRTLCSEARPVEARMTKHKWNFRMTEVRQILSASCFLHPAEADRGGIRCFVISA
jgi:hypothetical protein